MEKTIKVIALMNHHLLIAEIDEVAAADIGQPDCKLTNPFIINTETGSRLVGSWYKISFSKIDVFFK